MFHIDSTFRFARPISIADLDSFGGVLNDLSSLSDEWEFLVIEDVEGLFRI